jgi:hypothetical protein
MPQVASTGTRLIQSTHERHWNVGFSESCSFPQTKIHCNIRKSDVDAILTLNYGESSALPIPDDQVPLRDSMDDVRPTNNTH